MRFHPKTHEGRRKAIREFPSQLPYVSGSHQMQEYVPPLENSIYKGLRKALSKPSLPSLSNSLYPNLYSDNLQVQPSIS